MNLKPLADRVVLKRTEAEEKTKGGIILTSAAQEKPEVYEVIVVGPGGMVDGNEVKMEVKAGDKVIAGKYSGTSVKLDGEEYTIVRQSDILAIVEYFRRTNILWLRIWFMARKPARLCRPALTSLPTP